MWIEKFPVEFDIRTPEEIENVDKLGFIIEPKIEPGYLYVNMDNINSFNKSTDGFTVLRMQGGDWRIEMKFNDFLDVIHKNNNKIKQKAV